METGSEIPEEVKGVCEFGPSEIAVALHFVERFSEVHAQNDQAQANDGPTVFTSMELDLLAYQFQTGCPPMKSGLPGNEATLAASASRLLFIKIPDTFTYYSEGRRVPISISPKLIEAQVRLSWTHFRASSLRVWHCIITPAKNGSFDEYAILAQIHLYDGRAESTQLRSTIEFHLDSRNAATITGADNLLESLKRKHLVPIPGEVQPPKEKHFIAGTIQYAPRVSGTSGQKEGVLSSSDLLENIQKVWQARRDKDKEKNPALDALKKLYDDFENGRNRKPWEELRAFAGIVVGIFDFRRVDLEEMLDTLAPTFCDGHVFLQMNRCSLTACTPDDRVIQDSNVREQIGISPYLLLPHAAIIHNETMARLAELALDAVHGRIESGRDALHLAVFIKKFREKFRLLFARKSGSERDSEEGQVMTGSSAKLGSSSLEDLERELEEASRNLGELQLPNVFNYVTERTLFEKGMETRGFLDKRKAVEAKRIDTKEQIELLWKLRAEGSQIWVAALLAAFTGISLVMSNQKWLGNTDEAPQIALLLGLILSLAVIYLRRKGLKQQG